MAPLMQVEEAQQLQAKARKRGQLIQGAGVDMRRAKDVDKQAKLEAKKPEAEQNPEVLKRCKRDYGIYEQQRKDKQGAARLLNTELIALDKVVKLKHREILIANPVYTNPGRGWLVDRGCRVAGWIAESEVDGVVVPGCHAVLEDSDLEVEGVLCPDGQTVDGLMQVWMAKGERQQTLIDGTYIDDYRGLTEWVKTESDGWIGYVLKELGEEKNPNAILDADLTDEQRAEIDSEIEVSRLAGLSDDDRAAEFNASKTGLAGQAQAMENELKFDGKDLAPAQAWYDAELVGLKSKYGVTE